jgi:hypothetical protein
VVIAFAFAFLGLILGPHQIAFVVEGDVALVRVELDGNLVAELTEEPWSLECDFGPELHPHELEAIAFDPLGREIDRARQLINLPRERAETALILEGDGAGNPESARLIWQHIEYSSAELVAFRFDGAELPLIAPNRVRLPEYDPSRLHLLEAELRFQDGAHYRAEVNISGRTGFGADAELTGLTLVAPPDSQLDVQDLGGWFERDGQVVEANGLERAPAKIVIVVDETAIPSLRRLAAFGSALTTHDTELREGEQLRFLFPNVRRTAAKGVPSRLFSISQPFSVEDGSIPWILTRLQPPEPSPARRVNDAIAVAAIEAAAGNRPRAVVLVLGRELEDTSAYGIGEVENFLRELRVPLFVWWTGQPLSRTVSEDKRPLTMNTPWGKANDISSRNRIIDATETLRLELDSQVTVWIDGSHLPHEIELTKRAPSTVRFAE